MHTRACAPWYRPTPSIHPFPSSLAVVLLATESLSHFSAHTHTRTGVPSHTHPPWRGCGSVQRGRHGQFPAGHESGVHGQDVRRTRLHDKPNLRQQYARRGMSDALVLSISLSVCVCVRARECAHMSVCVSAVSFQQGASLVCTAMTCDALQFMSDVVCMGVCVSLCVCLF